jgi:hypothetical protein
VRLGDVDQVREIRWATPPRATSVWLARDGPVYWWTTEPATRGSGTSDHDAIMLLASNDDGSLVPRRLIDSFASRFFGEQ